MSVDNEASDVRGVAEASTQVDDRWPAPRSRPTGGNPWPVVGSGWILVAVWVVTRAVMLRQWSGSYRYITGDPDYYFWALRYTPSIGQRLPEYPAPVVAFLDLFTWPSANVGSSYVLAFAIGMALLDAAFTLVLWRSPARTAAWYWMLFGFLMGPLIWFRFDVLPAVIVGVALLWVTRRPGLSGIFLGLGAAIKLWPALLLLPLAHRGQAGRRRVEGLLITGGLLALISWAAVGWTRLVSPLTWQNDRGLQVESVPASLAMAGKAYGRSTLWSIAMSRYNAYEISGPGVATALLVSAAFMAVVVAVAVVFAMLGWLSSDNPGRRLTAFDLSLAGVAIIALLIVANKTFSPQYMFWIGAPLAVLLHHGLRRGSGSAAASGGDWRIAAGLGGLGLAAAALTQVVFPANYSDIIFVTPADPVTTGVLLLRNLLMVVIAVAATAAALPRFLRSVRA